MAAAPVLSVLADGLSPSEITRQVRRHLEAGECVVAVDFAQPRPADTEVACELARLQRFMEQIGARLVVRTFVDGVVVS